MIRQNPKVKSIQWQFVWGNVALTAGTVVLIFAVYWLVVGYIVQKPEIAAWLAQIRSTKQPFVVNMWIWSFLLLALFIAVVVGTVSGYVVGNLLKKRLQILWEAAMHLERGLLSYRVPELGVDELGEVGWQFNRLAAKWEDQVASLQRLSAHNATLGEQLRQTAVVEERQRLARELHDAVSQQLFAIAMTTAAIKRLLEKNPQRAAQQIELVEEMAAAAQAEMRALLLHLRPATLQNKSLKEAVHGLLNELTQKHVAVITWEIGDISGLASGIEDQLFRILQEALSNTLRHARATHVEVKLFCRQGVLRLRIADDGIGFDLDGEKMTSYGLLSMKERVSEIGGALEIYSSIGKGTQIEVRVPVMIESQTKGESGDDSSYVSG